MKTTDMESTQKEIPVFNSITDIEKYFSEQTAEEKKWGILYPLIIGIELFPYRIKKIENRIVWAFQRAVRKNHAADVDLLRLDFHIAKLLLPKLEAFRNQRLHVSPTGDMGTWLNVLDEIIYAFKWNVYANWEKSPKRERDFYLCHLGEDEPALDFFHYDDSALVKKAADRAQRGFELFGKYFIWLWNY